MKEGMNIQRTILWVVFGMALFTLYNNWQHYNGRPGLFEPPQTVKDVAKGADGAKTADPAKTAKDSSVPTGVTPPAVAPAGAPPVPPVGPAPAAAAQERVKVETDIFRAEIDPNGAVLARTELRKQRVAPDWHAVGLMSLFTGKKMDLEANEVLLDSSAERTYHAQSGLLGGTALPNHRTPFTRIDGPTKLEDGKDALEVKFAAESGGVKLVKAYVFKRGRYDIEVRHEITNTGAEPVMPSLYLQLLRDGKAPEGESGAYSTFTGPAVYTDAEKFHKIDFSDIEKNKATLPKSAKDGWVAMIQHYFVAAWVPPQGAQRENFARMVDKNLFAAGSILPLVAIAPGATAASQATLYVGPQDQNALKEIAPGLDLAVDYGWLTFIAKPLFWLLQFFYDLVGNWGWAIILLTVLVKAAFYPLSAASYKSMAKMKEVTPRLTALREKYGDDKQKLNAAMMELYRTEKINPLGGCLPIVVQIPVFIALYWVLLASVEMRNAPWVLWIHDLATPDPWFVLPLVMMASMWIQYKLNPTPPDPVQAKVMALMPIIFGIMFFLFPAGLVLYWVVNNILSIIQQWYVNTHVVKKPVG